MVVNCTVTHSQHFANMEEKNVFCIYGEKRHFSNMGETHLCEKQLIVFRTFWFSLAMVGNIMT